MDHSEYGRSVLGLVPLKLVACAFGNAWHAPIHCR